jgi:hypothetical protein
LFSVAHTLDFPNEGDYDLTMLADLKTLEENRQTKSTSVELALSGLLVIIILAVSTSTVVARQVGCPMEWMLAEFQDPKLNQAPEANPPAWDNQAQSSQTPTSGATSPTSSTAKQFFKDILHDQKGIWTSPLRVKKKDARWLVPFAAVTGALIATDRKSSAEASESKDHIEDSRDFSTLGSGYATFGAAGTMYLVGHLTHNDRLAETGLLGTEALINSSIVVMGLKLATGRERPESNQGQGRFLHGGQSFPSGHTITTWALATVIAEKYRDQPLIRFGAYGLAAAVGLSRFSGRNHFLSDVAVGGTLGYLIGHYTVRHHNPAHPGHAFPAIQPYFNQATRTYGLAGSLIF